MSALLNRLADQYSALSSKYDDLLNRSADRALTVAEMAELDQARDAMDQLGERLIVLRRDEERQWAGHDFMARHEPAPAHSTTGQSRRGSTAGSGLEVRSVPAVQVRVHSEPVTYHPPDAGRPQVPFFRDLFHAQIDGDRDAIARIDRHQMEVRTMGTSTTGPGVLPPNWLFQEFAILAHYSRPWADTLRRLEITDANPVNIGQQTAGAAVTVQTEGNAPNDGSFVANLLTTNPKTYTGKVDVSRQVVDGSNPAIDSLVYADAMGSYNEQVEMAVAAAFEALTPTTITYPGAGPYPNMFDCIIDAGASVRKHRKSTASAVFCSDGAWAYMAKQKDSSNRPLVTTGDHGPTNAYGVAVANAAQYGHVAAEVVDLAVIPSWAGNDNHLFVCKADDFILLESSTFNFRYEEVLGPEAIRLGVWGYAAPILARYATSTIKIDAGTTIPAPAEAADTGKAAKK